MSKKSHVYIVGAGPGDPGLITVKGQYLLKQADVILADHLVHPTLLSQCAPSTQHIYVGKQKGKHSSTQTDIHEHLLHFAKQNKSIVRLKGGDPFVFGRIGEEMTFLAQHNIPFSIIPGVSSATAGPGYLGIPLTHRDHSRSVAFVTGTLKKGRSPLHIPDADTLVFFMGYSHLTDLIPTLKKTKTGSTPICLISQATHASQQHMHATLDTILDKIKQHTLPTPILIVVGNVATLAHENNWLPHLPLSKKRIVLFRDSHAAQDWITPLQTLGAEVLHIPIQHYPKNPETYPKITSTLLKNITHLIFSSATAVKHFCDALLNNHCDTRHLHHICILSIGNKTTQTLNTYGLIPDIEAKTSSIEGIINALPKSLNNAHILYPTSSKSPDTLATFCKQKSLTLTRINLYTPTPLPLQHPVSFNDTDICIITSPSTLDHLNDVNLTLPQKSTKIAIGPTTATYLNKNNHQNIIELPTPSITACIDYIKNV